MNNALGEGCSGSATGSELNKIFRVRAFGSREGYAFAVREVAELSKSKCELCRMSFGIVTICKVIAFLNFEVPALILGRVSRIRCSASRLRLENPYTRLVGCGSRRCIWQRVCLHKQSEYDTVLMDA